MVKKSGRMPPKAAQVVKKATRGGRPLAINRPTRGGTPAKQAAPAKATRGGKPKRKQGPTKGKTRYM